jgi:glycosyltransferase involved in cell wall biosynthesis
LRDVVRFIRDYRALVPAISNAIEHQRPDLIYINGPRLVFAASRASGNTPVVFHSHSYLSRRYAVSLIGHELHRKGTAVIAASRFVAEPWMKYTDVSVIYNGTRDIGFLPKAGPSNRPWRIGVIGRIAPEKGQLEFVHAARHLVDGGLHAEFYIYGAPLWSSDAYLDAVRLAAKDLDVRFAGWSSCVGEILHGLDLLVVPSPSHESTTRVILEAFSAGTPVVAFPAGGIPEVVDPGNNGFLAEAVTVRALTEAIQGAIERRETLPAIAASARRDWNIRFTVTRYCADVMAAMELTARRTKTGNRNAASRTTAAAAPKTGP